MNCISRRSALLALRAGGPASIGHICDELIRKEIKVELVHETYRRCAPMTTDQIAWIFPMGIDMLTVLVPDVPTVVEVGCCKLVQEFFGLPAEVWRG